jgi:aminoglycoside phosphotransferase (APT) family kinase protein
MDFEKKVLLYLMEQFGPGAALKGMERRGKGTHGTGYLLRFTLPGEERELILKSLSPSGFGHDHYSDRAQVLLLAQSNYNEMDKHVQALDVVGDSPGRLISLREAREFFIFMEKAQGTEYFKDLDTVLEQGRLDRRNRERAQELARFAAGVHQKKYTGDEAKTLYRRRIRDLIGHGECIMGIIDAYDGADFTSDAELVEYAEKALPWWGGIRNRAERLCEVHGDFHPGNIWFEERDFVLLDRARGTWGEPADDVSCLGANYIYYAIKERDSFNGPFAELFHIFTETYVDETRDYGFFDVAPPFFAFRVLVIAHPKFYPHDGPEIKRRLLNFGLSVLEDDKFHVDRINDYLRL